MEILTIKMTFLLLKIKIKHVLYFYYNIQVKMLNLIPYINYLNYPPLQL